MLNTNQYENEEYAIKSNKPMHLRVTYTPRLAGKLSHAINFVIRKLGFSPAGEISLSGDPAFNPLTVPGANNSKLTIILQKLEDNSGISNIIFHTDDCLRDYHKYILAGIEFISRPEYNEAGLQLSFTDNENNCYTLLEERNYTE